nr:hypothetical protein [uncultured Rhodopila sp.]
MASYSWKSSVGGDWNTATNWTPAGVPNDAAADVTIDAPTTALYTVTIAAGESETVHSLTMNGVNNLAGSNISPYTAAQLSINGTLTFAPGSTGTLGGSVQNYIIMNGGTIVNPGTLNGFIQARGNVLMTGTNGFYITNWLQSLGGIVTVDVSSIAEMTGNTLFDGIFEAQGNGAIINFGGPRENMIVNIATIEGPPLIPGGWTEILLNGTLNDIGEWNGTGYVGIETTLKEIGTRGTVDIIGGRAYNTANALTVAAGGMINLQAGIVTTGGIDINAGGVVQGSGTLNSGVVNNGVLMAEGGLLTVGAGGLVGVGLVEFDTNLKTGVKSPTGTVMEVHGVGPYQTFVMNGDDALVIDTPVSFAGNIIAKPGDQILLGGVVANAAVLQGQNLLVQENGATVATLKLAGSYTGDTFSVTPLAGGSSKVTVVGPAAADDSTTIQEVPYVGPVAGLQHQYIDITTASLNITATAPNSFIATGSGNDSINVSRVNGNNVLDGGGGSNFLTGGTGDDTFYLDASNPTAATMSTVVNFHSGDDLTIWGVNLSDFTETLVNNAGAAGYTGLAVVFSAPGRPAESVVLAGYTSADLTNGRLVQSVGKTSDLPGLPGSEYVTIHGA